MVEHLSIVVFLSLFIIPVNSVYSLSEVNEASKEFTNDRDVLSTILDALSITVLIVLTLVLILIGVLIFFMCKCSPSSTATTFDETEYRYQATNGKDDVLFDHTGNQKSRKTARKLSMILECQLDPISMV